MPPKKLPVTFSPTHKLPATDDDLKELTRELVAVPEPGAQDKAHVLLQSKQFTAEQLCKLQGLEFDLDQKSVLNSFNTLHIAARHCSAQTVKALLENAGPQAAAELLQSLDGQGRSAIETAREHGNKELLEDGVLTPDLEIVKSSGSVRSGLKVAKPAPPLITIEDKKTLNSLKNLMRYPEGSVTVDALKKPFKKLGDLSKLWVPTDSVVKGEVNGVVCEERKTESVMEVWLGRQPKLAREWLDKNPDLLTKVCYPAAEPLQQESLEGFTALHLAIQSGNVKVVEEVLDLYKNHKQLEQVLNPVLGSGQLANTPTALNLAFAQKNGEILRALLNAGANPAIASPVRFGVPGGAVIQTVANTIELVRLYEPQFRSLLNEFAVIPARKLLEHYREKPELTDAELTQIQLGRYNLLQWAAFLGDVAFTQKLLNQMSDDLTCALLQTAHKDGLTPVHVALSRAKMNPEKGECPHQAVAACLVARANQLGMNMTQVLNPRDNSGVSAFQEMVSSGFEAGAFFIFYKAQEFGVTDLYDALPPTASKYAGMTAMHFAACEKLLDLMLEMALNNPQSLHTQTIANNVLRATTPLDCLIENDMIEAWHARVKSWNERNKDDSTKSPLTELTKPASSLCTINGVARALQENNEQKALAILDSFAFTGEHLNEVVMPALNGRAGLEKYQWNLFRLACSKGQHAIAAKMLALAGQDKDLLLNPPFEMSCPSPLMTALSNVKNNDFSTADWLINHGARLDVPISSDLKKHPNRCAPVHHFAEIGDRLAFWHLVQRHGQRIDVRPKDIWGDEALPDCADWSPLHFAAHNLQLLMQQEKGQTPQAKKVLDLIVDVATKHPEQLQSMATVGMKSPTPNGTTEYISALNHLGTTGLAAFFERIKHNKELCKLLVWTPHGGPAGAKHSSVLENLCETVKQDVAQTQRLKMNSFLKGIDHRTTKLLALIQEMLNTQTQLPSEVRTTVDALNTTLKFEGATPLVMPSSQKTVDKLADLFHAACQAQNLDVLKPLWAQAENDASRQALLKTKNKKGYTALHKAALKGHINFKETPPNFLTVFVDAALKTKTGLIEAVPLGSQDQEPRLALVTQLIRNDERASLLLLDLFKFNVVSLKEPGLPFNGLLADLQKQLKVDEVMRKLKNDKPLSLFEWACMLGRSVAVQGMLKIAQVDRKDAELALHAWDRLKLENLPQSIHTLLEPYVTARASETSLKAKNQNKHDGNKGKGPMPPRAASPSASIDLSDSLPVTIAPAPVKALTQSGGSGASSSQAVLVPAAAPQNRSLRTEKEDIALAIKASLNPQSDGRKVQESAGDWTVVGLRGRAIKGDVTEPKSTARVISQVSQAERGQALSSTRAALTAQGKGKGRGVALSAAIAGSAKTPAVIPAPAAPMPVVTVPVAAVPAAPVAAAPVIAAKQIPAAATPLIDEVKLVISPPAEESRQPVLPQSTAVPSSSNNGALPVDWLPKFPLKKKPKSTSSKETQTEEDAAPRPASPTSEKLGAMEATLQALLHEVQGLKARRKDPFNVVNELSAEEFEALKAKVLKRMGQESTLKPNAKPFAMPSTINNSVHGPSPV